MKKFGINIGLFALGTYIGSCLSYANPEKVEVIHEDPSSFVQRYDSCRDGLIDIKEFLESPNAMSLDFQRFDRNKDMRLDSLEMGKYLKH